jgi:hypothetical protein
VLYILFSFGPVYGEVLYAEPFIEVGDIFGDCVDYVGNLIADDELDILASGKCTLAAN